jgi:hypothetical protein
LRPFRFLRRALCRSCKCAPRQSRIRLALKDRKGQNHAPFLARAPALTIAALGIAQDGSPKTLLVTKRSAPQPEDPLSPRGKISHEAPGGGRFEPFLACNFRNVLHHTMLQGESVFGKQTTTALVTA